MPTPRMRRAFPVVIAKKRQSDVVPPTCVITADASGITADAFTATFTFSEDVTGFAITDITDEQNGVAAAIVSNFAGSGAVYTATITPDTAGEVTLSVAAGVCVDGAGNANEASNIFSILSAVGFVRAKNYSDVSTLWKDAARTSAVTANDDVVQGIADLASVNHDNGSTVGPKYKTNLIGTHSGLDFVSTVPNWLYDAAAVNIVGANSWTRMFAIKQDAGGMLSGIQGSGASTGRVWMSMTDDVQFNSDIPVSQPVLTPANWNLIVLQHNVATGKLRVRFNGSATWYEVTRSTYASSIAHYFTARGATGPLLDGNTAGWDLVAASVLDDAIIAKFLAYMNTYLDEVFF